MVVEGRVWKFGDHVNTDVIIPARHLNTLDETELSKYCFSGIREDFPKDVQQGDILVAGRNFGCGSSREHAPLAIKGAGISAIVAESFARIFYRNSFNVGLPALQCIQAARGLKEGDRISMELISGRIYNYTSGKGYKATPVPEFLREMVEAGGLVQYMRKMKRQQ